MNFLIISSPRCGSTSLQKSISNSYNSKLIYEPYSPWGIQQKNYKLENVVVKTMFHQIDNTSVILGNLPLSFFDKCYDFYCDLIPKFDNVILLGRENIKEHSESLANLYNGSSDNEKYVYKLVIDLNLIMNQLSLENTYLKKLSNNFNLPFDTYESIYYGNGLKNKEIKLDYNILDTKNKLRQFYDDKKLT
jgi:hypothetical protein